MFTFLNFINLDGFKRYITIATSSSFLATQYDLDLTVTIADPGLSGLMHPQAKLEPWIASIGLRWAKLHCRGNVQAQRLLWP